MKKNIATGFAILSLLMGFTVLTIHSVMAHTESDPFTTDLIAGQHHNVGDISVWNDGENLYVRYDTNENWCLMETHLHVASGDEEIPVTKGKRSNPIPGKFEYSKEYSTCRDNYTYKVNLSEEGIVKCGQDLKIAAHAVVQKKDGGLETAWGEGDRFTKKGNWGMYFGYEIQCPEQDFPREEDTAYIGYEDREGGDFDYNDFGMDMHIEENYELGSEGFYLSEVLMKFESRNHKAGDKHDIHVYRDLPSDVEYEYTIDRIGRSAKGHENVNGTYTGNGSLDIVIFDTKYFEEGTTVTVTISITSGFEPFDSDTETSPRWDVAADNPIFADYDPYMVDYSYGNAERHIDSWQNTGSKLPINCDVPYILVVPETDWDAPNEQVTITGPYPEFDDYYSSGAPEDWYLE